MNHRLPFSLFMIALLLLLICLLVLLTRTVCGSCGRPIYFYVLSFCTC